MFSVFTLFDKHTHTNINTHTLHYRTISPHPPPSRHPSREPGKRTHRSFLTAGTKHCMSSF